jgi:hypothetical protein
MSIRWLLATFAVLSITRAAPAQQSPRFSGSLLLGPERTEGGEFRNNAGVASEIGGTARLAVIRNGRSWPPLPMAALGEPERAHRVP